MAPIQFVGNLTRDTASAEVSFVASVDAHGELQIKIDPLALTRDTLYFGRENTDDRILPNHSLSGVGPHGETFVSETFRITRQLCSEAVYYEGGCGRADIQTPIEAVEGPQLIWHFRQFKTFRMHVKETVSGRVAMAGVEPSEDSQKLTGWLAIEAKEAPSPEWWNTAEKALEHITRVMGFACGTYLRPFVECRIDGGTRRIRVNRQGPASPPFLPPFHFLNLGPIFDHACSSQPNKYEQLKKLDSAIQWLLAPASYSEMRLISAMTAIENIVSREPLEKQEFLPRSEFRKLTKTLRSLIEELGGHDGMIPKLADINRISLDEKIADYLAYTEVSTHDLPEGAIKNIIRARNKIVHKGIYFDETNPKSSDLWENILITREILVRIVLSTLGYSGNYMSPYHKNSFIRFPECSPIAT